MTDASSSPDHVVVMTTVGSEEAARELSRALVDEGLVACAQRVPVESCYRWEGEVVDEREVLLLLKTPHARAGELVEALARRHPYEVPEVIELPVTGGWPPYLRWMEEQTASSA